MDYLSTTRRLHLDFHTPGFIENVAERFDAREYARTLADSGIQAVAAFAKCHYGYVYYPTAAGRMHPGLKFDLLGSMVSACAERDISVAAYYSLQFDNLYCSEHPDCEQVGLSDKSITGFWRVPCINTAYGDYVKAQVKEVASTYPVEGLWLDIVGYYPICLCKCCRERYEREMGEPVPNLKLGDEETADYTRYVHWQRRCVDSFIQELRSEARKFNHSIAIGCNTASGVYEKASGAFGVGEDQFIEESCTFQPQHYTYISYLSRLFDSNTQGKPFEICSQRFHQGWGDWTLRSADWLKFESATVAANGGRVSIGDQLYPDGRWEPDVYRNIGETYAWLAERDSVFGESESAAEAAIYVAGVGVYKDAGGTRTRFGSSICGEGAYRALLDSRYPVDLITNAGLNDLSRYRVVIIDQALAPSDRELEAFENYVRSGGNLVYIMSPGALESRFAWSNYDSPCPGEEAHRRLLSLFGVEELLPSKFSVCYIDRFDPALPGRNGTLPVLVRGRCGAATVETDVKTLARFTFPAAERSPDRFISHQHGHPAVESDLPAICVKAVGNGNALFIAAPVTSVYYERLYPPLREAVVSCLDFLTPRQAWVANAPSSLELVIRRSSGRLIAHLISASLARPSSAVTDYPGMVMIADRGVSIANMELVLRSDIASSTEAILFPGGQQLTVQKRNGYAVISLPPVSIHVAVDLVTGTPSS